MCNYSDSRQCFPYVGWWAYHRKGCWKWYFSCPVIQHYFKTSRWCDHDLWNLYVRTQHRCTDFNCSFRNCNSSCNSWIYGTAECSWKKNSGSVCAEGAGTQKCRRTFNIYSCKGEYCKRYACYFCILTYVHATDYRIIFRLPDRCNNDRRKDYGNVKLKLLV